MNEKELQCFEQFYDPERQPLVDAYFNRHYQIPKEKPEWVETLQIMGIIMIWFIIGCLVVHYC